MGIDQRKFTAYWILFICVSLDVVASLSDMTISTSFSKDDGISTSTDDQDDANLVSNFKASGKTIPLVLCCQEDLLYKSGLDMCSALASNRSLALPDVYSIKTNQTIAKVTDEIFSISDIKLAECQDGFVSHSTSDFLLFDDGSVRIGDQRLETNEFCINELDLRVDNILPTNPAKLVTRFCVPNPCVHGPCIRKCCPIGLAILSLPEGLGYTCLPYLKPFDASLLTFQNQTEGDASVNPTYFSIQGGYGLRCYVNGKIEISPVPSFVFLADGRMHYADEWEERTMSEYCVDQLSDYNSTSEDETVSDGWLSIFLFYVRFSLQPGILNFLFFLFNFSSYFLLFFLFKSIINN